MPLPRPHRASASFRHALTDVDEDVDAAAFLKPIVAGARARGIVDGLEMLGAGAILIDATGRVLHAGERARQMMAPHARIVGDHLVAERPSDNAAIQELIGSAIGAAPHDAGKRILLATDERGSGPSLRAIRVARDEGNAQLLRAVLVLEQPDRV